MIIWSPSRLGHLHADDDGFLSDIEVAETADQAHAIHLAGLFLETPDQKHLPQRLEFLFLVEFRTRRMRWRASIGRRRAFGEPWFGFFGLGDGHCLSSRHRRVPSHSRNRPIAEVGDRRDRLPATKSLAVKFILGRLGRRLQGRAGSCRRAAAGQASDMRSLGMSVVEEHAGPFVEHVGVEPARFEQRHPALPLFAFA